MLLTVEYQTDIDEITNAALYFFNSRPFIKLLLLIMKACCALASIIYLLKAYAGTIAATEVCTLIAISVWLCKHQQLNNKLFKRTVTRQLVLPTINKFQLSQHKLTWQHASDRQPGQQEWRRLKYIYQVANGYIVPYSGVANAGKFIWLPKRGFDSPGAEQQFLALLSQLKIKLK